MIGKDFFVPIETRHKRHAMTCLYNTVTLPVLLNGRPAVSVYSIT